MPECCSSCFRKANLYFSSNNLFLRGFFTENSGIIRNNIEGNVLFYRVLRVISH